MSEGVLWISESKLEEIERQWSNDELRLKTAIDFYLKKYPLASWRDIIDELDNYGEEVVADGIRQFAEPLTGNDNSHIIIGKFVCIHTQALYCCCLICMM